VLDQETVDTYSRYFNRFALVFKTLENITTPTIKVYLRNRLGHVKASTVRKELSALRSFLLWCAASPPDGPGLIKEAPLVPSVPNRVLGTAHKNGKREAQWWSIEETLAILHALPERSERWGHRIRAALYVMYQTSLRPGTIAALSVPENYAPGSRELRIWAEDDKGRYQRVVQLSRGARLMLFWCRPRARGKIFGEHDYRWELKKAAAQVLGKREGRTAQIYNLRRARITHAAEITGNVRMTQEIAGHTRLSTTETYFERLRTKRGTAGVFRELDRATRKRPT
jgi:integrase